MSAFAAALMAFFWVLKMCLFGRILYSWIDQNPHPNNEVKQVLWAITEPILKPLRAVIPPLGMFDVSVLVAFFLIEFLQRILLRGLA